MFLVLISLLFAGLLTALALRRKSRSGQTRTGAELDAYFATEEPGEAQKRQLLRAARVLISESEQLEKKLEAVEWLHHERLVSEEYFRRHRATKDDLALDRMLIEGEIDFYGTREAFFNEARKLPETKKHESQHRWFDEKLYLKKREVMQSGLYERAGVKLNAA